MTTKKFTKIVFYCHPECQIRVRKNVYTVLGVDCNQNKEREKETRAHLTASENNRDFLKRRHTHKSLLLKRSTSSFCESSKQTFTLNRLKPSFFVKVYSNLSWIEFCANLFLYVLKIHLRDLCILIFNASLRIFPCEEGVCGQSTVNLRADLSFFRQSCDDLLSAQNCYYVSRFKKKRKTKN